MLGDSFHRGEIVHCPLIAGPTEVYRIRVVNGKAYYKVRRFQQFRLLSRGFWVTTELLLKWPGNS